MQAHDIYSLCFLEHNDVEIHPEFCVFSLALGPASLKSNFSCLSKTNCMIYIKFQALQRQVSCL